MGEAIFQKLEENYKIKLYKIERGLLSLKS